MYLDPMTMTTNPDGTLSSSLVATAEYVETCSIPCRGDVVQEQKGFPCLGVLVRISG